MRYTVMIVERQKLAPPIDPLVSCPPPVPGGMRANLFSPGCGSDNKTRPATDFQDTAVSLQLLVAFILLICEKRDQAITSLMKAFAMDQHVVQDEGLRQQSFDEDEGEGTPCC